MNEMEAKELCVALMQADKEEEVIELLIDSGHWDDEAAWRYYGDRESNYNTIGNQMSRPDAALVEKLVNAVDARLINECLTRGLPLEGPDAPKFIREAVARFFEENPNQSTAGLIREWPNNKRTEVARDIALFATGATPKKGNYCLTISDCGEGQTPELMPYTLLSLDKSIKLRIPFVHGKFNMGSTGALKFCGKRNLQLVLSRRNPDIPNGISKNPSDSQWGFTIVRREDPEGGRRNSVFTFLAPIGSREQPKKGGVLRFTAEAIPIFPEGNRAYSRDSQWGTLIKLYEYSVPGYKTHILRKGGLLGRIDLRLPHIALPIRLYECRPEYGGHEGSYETTLTGLSVRLEDDKAKNLEDGFPSSCPMSVAGQQLTATIFAFRKGAAATYRKNEGIIFTVNGQTHGHLTTDFFRRKKLGLSYLAESLLVIVDCSKIDGRTREDLFMNSRDRLSGVELRSELEGALEYMLKHHQGLRDLKERRRREESESKLDDSKPLEDVLQLLLKQSPSLTNLFLQGRRLSVPFKTKKVQEQAQEFQGELYPTYFKFKDTDYGSELVRDCHINMRSRIIFETDCVNDYFSRNVDPGELSLFLCMGEREINVQNYSLNLQNGIATLNLQLPANCVIGDELRFLARVNDDTQIEPFENHFVLSVKEPQQTSKSKKTRRRNSPGTKDGGERESAAGIELPKIRRVYEAPENGKKGWDDMEPPFDRMSALRIINAGTSNENGGSGEAKDIYDFYVNIDNLYLKNELKSNGLDSELTNSRFVYGMVLLGLGLLYQDGEKTKGKGENDGNQFDEESKEINIEDKVEEFTKGAASVLLPLIEYLGDWTHESIEEGDVSGEDA